MISIIDWCNYLHFIKIDAKEQVYLRAFRSIQLLRQCYHWYLVTENMQQQRQRQQQYGQFLITISNKQNEVVKFINNYQQIKCQKIINLDTNKDRQLIHLYRMQLDRIKDYLQRRYQLSSQLSISNHLQIKQSIDTHHLFLKINTQYIQYPTLQDYLKQQSIKLQSQMQRTQKTLKFFIIQFLQIILRAGGIDYFFYTPRNVFIVSSKSDIYELKLSRVLVNFTSMTGSKLFLQNKGIYKQDLWQIYPLIPPNFYSHFNKEMTLQLNNIIKKRTLGFLIICFIIKKVPNLIETKKLDVLVNHNHIESLLTDSVRLFQKIIKLFEKSFIDAMSQTGIDFIKLIRDIFILPYLKENIQFKGYKFITWEGIYKILFPIQQPQDSSIINAQIYFNKMIANIWRNEQNKKYFEQRQFVQKGIDNKKELCSGSGMIYFLTKFNCSFHRILKYANPCQLILNEHFSQDLNQIIVKLMKLLSKQQVKNDAVQIEPQEQIADMRVKGQKIPLIPVNQAIDYELYNPFSIKSHKQVQKIKQQISSEGQIKTSFINSVKNASQFVNSAYTFQYFDKKLDKTLISVSHKQLMMSEFCSALWKC